MARPKKTLPPKKEKQLTLRLTDDLYDTLTADAARAHLPRTEYIRQLITDQKPVIHVETVFDSAELLSILGDMGKIGSNLNQIAHHLNGGGYLDAQLKEEISQGIIALYKIRDMVREIAGEYRENLKDRKDG